MFLAGDIFVQIHISLFLIDNRHGATGDAIDVMRERKANISRVH